MQTPASLPLTLPGPRDHTALTSGGRQTSAAAAPLDTEAEMREAAAAAREDAEPAAPAADPDAPVEMVRPRPPACRRAGTPAASRCQHVSRRLLTGALQTLLHPSQEAAACPSRSTAGLAAALPPCRSARVLPAVACTSIHVVQRAPAQFHPALWPAQVSISVHIEHYICAY